jgi:hypothetical protein
MGLLLVLLLCASSTPAQGETLTASLAVSSVPADGLPTAAELQSGLQRLFDLRYGSIVSLDFGQAAAGPAARVSVASSEDRVTVSTDVTRAGLTRSLVSTLPRGSPASLLATAAGDLAFLFFSARGLGTLPLSPPPSLAATLSTDTLAVFTGWNADELEPVALAGRGDEITVCFPHRYLTLGPRFRVTASTIADLNAQSLGREPLQLSGLVPGPADRLLLLSEQSGAVAEVDRRLGTRSVSTAPGLSALPARRAEDGTLVSLPGSTGAAGLRLYQAAGAGPVRTLDIAASYLSALDEDGEGNLWVWDAGERRVRVVTLGGQEVFSIKPLFAAASMPLPQQLAVFDDGSFLLAGSGEVWKFQASGIPVWRLSRIPGRPGESLPSSFDLSVDRSGGTLTILDAQSRRLLAFSPAPAEGEVRLSGALSRLDTRRPADLREASTLALSDGLGLMAFQLADLAARSGGTEADRAQARIELLAEKAAGFAGLADELSRGLLLERADGAYLRASAALREWSAESPADQSAAALLQNVLARRREVRAALLGSAEIRVVSARLVGGPGAGCVPVLNLSVRLRNAGSQPAADIRLHVSVPAATAALSLVRLDSIPGGREADVLVPLGPAEAQSARSTAAATAYALVTWQRGQEGASSAFTFPVQVPEESAAVDAASAQACRAVPRDTLAAGLADTLLSGARPLAPQPLADLAGILDALGAARTARAVPAAGADRPVPSSPGSLSMRAALRGLSPDERDWAVVTASVASSLGMPAAIVSRGERFLVAVDTGVPFFTGLAALPGLDGFQSELASISPSGTLWVPLSCGVVPAGLRASAWAFLDGLEALRAAGSSPSTRADLPRSEGAENPPIPFPLVLPTVTARLSAADVLAAAGAALEGAH